MRCTADGREDPVTRVHIACSFNVFSLECTHRTSAGTKVTFTILQCDSIKRVTMKAKLTLGYVGGRKTDNHP
jgi:hypothetical protein